MKRLVMLLALAVSLTACSPSEISAWQRWFRTDPSAAQAALKKHVKHHAPVPANAPMGSKCPEWYDNALAAGFTFQQWRTVDRIMWRESRCQQGAHNAAGANGLMQVMAMWADDCGTTVKGLREGNTNLRCAKHVLDVQGWEAWTTY